MIATPLNAIVNATIIGPADCPVCADPIIEVYTANPNINEAKNSPIYDCSFLIHFLVMFVYKLKKYIKGFICLNNI